MKWLADRAEWLIVAVAAFVTTLDFLHGNFGWMVADAAIGFVLFVMVSSGEKPPIPKEIPEYYDPECPGCQEESHG